MRLSWGCAKGLENSGKRPVRGDKPCFSICGDYELDFVVVNGKDDRIGLEVKTTDNGARFLLYFKEHGLIDKAYRTGLLRGGHGEKGLLQNGKTFCNSPFSLAGNKPGISYIWQDSAGQRTPLHRAYSCMDGNSLLFTIEKTRQYNPGVPGF